MKKTFTLLIIVVVAIIMNLGTATAKTSSFFPNYFINQNFDGVEAWPAGWSLGTGTTAYMGRAGTTASFGSPAQGFVTISGSGSGARGGELRFPSTATSQFRDSTVWVIEFEWTANAVGLNGMSAATAVTLLGPNSVSLNNNTNFWAASIFEFYVYNATGKIHYSNLDPIGRDSVTKVPFHPEGLSIPVGFASDGNNSYFGRRGATVAITDSLNRSTKTKINFGISRKYKVFAEINFATQMVNRFAMYEMANPTNGDTILNKPFIAPWVVGSVTTVGFEDRKVTQFDRLASWATRPPGANAFSNHSFDNLQTYVWKQSIGVADVSINYIDRLGNTVKPPRIIAGQQVNSTVWLSPEDKMNFVSGDGLHHYFYDEVSTRTANAAKSADGESLTVGFAGAGNTLTVVLKKVAITAGAYVWSGDASGRWNYLDDNFKISGGAPMSYQPGNEAIFSNVDAITKTVEVVGNVELNQANMTISAPDYVFTGTGRILGTGTLNISAGTTLGADNRLVGGAIIQTNQPVTVKHAAPATKFATTLPEISMNLEAGATFTRAIEGTAGSTLNLNLISLNEYAPAISGFSTVNIRQGVQTSLHSATWRTGWGGTLPANAQINYYNDVVGDAIPNGLGITNIVMQNTKLHLGPHTRLVRQFNENSNNADVVLIGELTGAAGSRLESGFVDGRYFRYDIGGLGTDAVFNGEIGPFIRTHVPATETTPAVTTYAANGVGVTKSGAGTWTVNGNFNFPTGTRGSQLNVSGGKFVVNGNVLFPNSTTAGSQINVTGGGVMEINGKITFTAETAAHVIVVNNGVLQLSDSVIAPAMNQIALTVDAAGTLKTGNNFIGASSVISNGIVEGGGKFANSFSLTNELATLKLKVNSFAEGGYEFVETLGDISIKKGIIDITVTGPVSGSKQIHILKAGGNYDILDNIAFIQILVNGKNITGNTAQTEFPEGGQLYYFDPETGILGHLGTSGLNDVNAHKEVKSIDYFNLMGQKVTKYHTGYILKRTTYTDNSVETIKYLNHQSLIDRQ